MTKRLDWRRARRPRAIEHKLGSATVLKNGARTPLVPTDALARKAERAFGRWERTLSPRQRKLLEGGGA